MDFTFAGIFRFFSNGSQGTAGGIPSGTVSLEKTPDPLKSSHVVTVEPGLYYIGMGGVRLEDVVLVTPDGNRNLTRYPKFLEI